MKERGEKLRMSVSRIVKGMEKVKERGGGGKVNSLGFRFKVLINRFN